MRAFRIPPVTGVANFGLTIFAVASRRFLFSFLLFVIAVVFAGAVAAVEIRVNAGGSQYTDGVGNVWVADTGFNTGPVSSAGNGVDILGTTDDPLYQLQRYDAPQAPELTYSFAVPNGDYVVNLHLAENYSGTFGVGLRVFDVQVEGAPALSDVDIFSEAGGANTALVRTIPLVTVSDGQLDIQFIHGVQNPIVAAIEILSLGGGTPDIDAPTVPQNVTATALGTTQVDVSWDASTDVGGGVVAGYNVYRADVGLLATVTGTSYSDTTVLANTSYDYTVSAFDNATPANESAQSSPAANVTTPPAPAVAIRVNAGGSQYTDGVGNVWSADTGFNTGPVSSAGNGVDILGTTDDPLYQLQRYDAPQAPELTYSFAVPNGDYAVNLHLAENYSGTFGVGLRVFDVQVEGAPALSDVDIFSEAGGANTALVRTIPLVTVSDGQLDIQFIHGVQNPIVAAIEILSLGGGTPDIDAPTVPQNVTATALGTTQVDVSWDASTDVGGGVVAGYNVYRADVGLLATVTGTSYSDTTVLANTSYDYTVSAFDNATPANESAQSSPAANVTTPPAPAVAIRVNAGGSQYTDGVGNVWSADTGFNTGPVSSAGNGVDILGTTDDPLYQLQRYDAPQAPELTYSFAVPNGDYAVNLHLAENYSGTFGVGLRVFDVQVEGAPALSDVDIFSEAGGANTALVRTIPLVTVSDGQLDIQFIHGVQNPIVAAIEILSLGGGTPDIDAPTVPQNVTATALGTTQVDVSWDASTDVGGGVVAGYNVYRADVGLLATVTGTSYSDTTVLANTSYDYTVSAFDNATPANESAQSTPAANVTTPAPAPDIDAPTVPQNVTATALGTTQVDVSWDASTDVGGGVVAGYNVYRADVGLLATVTGTSYSDTTVLANTSYDYTVSAFDNATPANESAQSIARGERDDAGASAGYRCADSAAERDCDGAWYDAGGRELGCVH